MLFDTELLLHNDADSCIGDNELNGPDPNRPFADTLSNMLAGAANRFVIVAFHHPLSSRGRHGGFFTWQQHLFPLVNVTSLQGTIWPYLLAVPVLPSLLYYFPRQAGLYSRQDIANPRYRQMAAHIEDALNRNPGARVLLGRQP